MRRRIGEVTIKRGGIVEKKPLWGDIFIPEYHKGRLAKAHEKKEYYVIKFTINDDDLATREVTQRFSLLGWKYRATYWRYHKTGTKFWLSDAKDTLQSKLVALNSVTIEVGDVEVTFNIEKDTDWIQSEKVLSDWL